MKKYFCILLLFLFLGALSLSAIAEEKQENGFFYVVMEDGTASITDCSLQGDIVIPSMIGGYTVTNLASQLFYGNSRVTSVFIPATVTYFGQDKKDNMWDYIFSYCNNLTSIQVDAENPFFCAENGVLYNKDKSMLINYPCAKAEASYTVSPSVNCLCCTSFARARNLKKLYLLGKDTYWMTYTFYDTGNLTVYYLSGGYTQTRVQQFIDAGLSYDSDSLYCSFTEMDGSFSQDNTLILPNDLTIIEKEAFAGVDCVTVWVPDNCTVIKSHAFANCKKLKIVSLPKAEGMNIASDAFSGCSLVKFEYRNR